MPRCLLCGEALRPFDPGHPNPEGIERALICPRHPERDLYDQGFAGFYGDLDDSYITGVRRVSTEIAGQTITHCRYTEGYFSLLFAPAKGGLLLIYPLRLAAVALFVPEKLRWSEAPRGLIPLTRETLAAARGPLDRNGTKPGLAGIVATIKRGLPLAGIELPRHPDMTVDPWRIVIRFEPDFALELSAAGWASGWGEELDAIDLTLNWLDGREPRLDKELGDEACR